MEREEFVELLKKTRDLEGRAEIARYAYERCLDVYSKSRAMARWCSELGLETIAREARAIHEYVLTFCETLKKHREDLKREYMDLLRKLLDEIRYWCRVEVPEDKFPLYKTDDTPKPVEPYPGQYVEVLVLKQGDYVVLMYGLHVPIDLLNEWLAKEQSEYRCRLYVEKKLSAY